MATPRDWGPILWKCIHHASYTTSFLLSHDVELDRLWNNFLPILPHLLPCSDCQNHFFSILHSTKPWQNSREIYAWFSTAHNYVYQRLHPSSPFPPSYLHWLPMEPFQTLSSWDFYALLCILWTTIDENPEKTFIGEYTMRLFCEIMGKTDLHRERQFHIWKKTWNTIPELFDLWRHYLSKYSHFWKQVPFSFTQIRWKPMPHLYCPSRQLWIPYRPPIQFLRRKMRIQP